MAPARGADRQPVRPAGVGGCHSVRSAERTGRRAGCSGRRAGGSKGSHRGPIQDYYNLNVGKIVEQLDNPFADELHHVRAYEQLNKNRDTLLGQIERRIKAAS